MSVYSDAYFVHDLATRISITETFVMIKITPIRCSSNLQKTVETLTYGSELLASRMPMELILEDRRIRLLVVALDVPSLKVEDDMPVVLLQSLQVS
jgi:hypothetical protein